MPYLRHWFNGQALSIFHLSDDLIIGRHPECEIRVDDATVSSRHARVFRGANGYRVEDLDSTNGVSISGAKVSRGELQHASRFTLGTQDFEFLETLPEELGETLEIKKSWIPGIYFAK